MQHTKIIQNVAGDRERERLSRKENFIEAISVMLIILTLLWLVAYPFGVVLQIKPVNTVVNILLVLGGAYLLLIAPFVHADTATSWGLGNPYQYWKLITTGTPLRRLSVILASLVVFVSLNILNYYQWRHVVRFFSLNAIAKVLGLNIDVNTLPHQFPGVIFVIFTGLILSSLITFCAIRYDNFLSAFKTAMQVSLPLLAVIIVSAVVQRGSKAFENFSLSTWAIGVFGYVFWGFVQQLLFSSYFGTRLRKAFAPSKNPNNVVNGEEKWKKVILIGIIWAVGAIVFACTAISIAYGANAIPDTKTWFRLAFWLTVFFFPMGVIYGYFYCKDKKRMLVATLSASCFGLIHIDSYGLVSATWILGIVLVYVFMEDKNRNLVALGFIHGLLGSTLQNFFSKGGKAGVLNIDYSVGPWNVEEPTWGTIIIPVIVILCYAISIWAYLKYAPEAKET
ncbi:MAG: hypothetical protein N3G21_06830 [Candidatus Hydrogenedentes bacterium]|nr:hypothetical protein [Candidatus Hydrogenedentota bacterium]